jgi:hypothetical protein
LVKYVEDLITYAPQDPLPGTKVIITNDPFNPIWLSERVTQGLGTAVAGIATFPGLTVRESIWIIAYHEGFRPEILPGVRVVNTSAYAYPGAAHHFSLVLPRINPFTSEMLRSTRNAKISVFEERPPRVAGGEWISVGSEGARVIITKQSGRRVYGLEPPATATGSNGIISGLALPDTGVDEAASGTLPPGAFGPTLYTIYAYKSGYYMAWMDGAAETLFSDRGVTLYLKKPHR